MTGFTGLIILSWTWTWTWVLVGVGFISRLWVDNQTCWTQQCLSYLYLENFLLKSLDCDNILGDGIRIRGFSEGIKKIMNSLCWLKMWLIWHRWSTSYCGFLILLWRVSSSTVSIQSVSQSCYSSVCWGIHDTTTYLSRERLLQYCHKKNIAFTLNVIHTLFGYWVALLY